MLSKNIIVLAIIITLLVILIGYLVSIPRKGRLIHSNEYIEIISPYPVHVFHDKYIELSENSVVGALYYEIYCDGKLLQPIHSKRPFFTYEVELNKIITIVIKLHNPNNFTVWVFLYLGWEYDEDFNNYYLNDSIDIKLIHFPKPKVLTFISQPTNIIHDFKPSLTRLEPNQTKILMYHIKIIKAGKEGFYPINIMVIHFKLIDGELWNFDWEGYPIAFQVKKS